MKPFKFIAGIAVVAVSAAASIAFAAADPAATSTDQSAAQQPPASVAVSNCGITSTDLATLKSIQTDPTLSYADELAKELAVRKSLLDTTITCSESDIQTLRTELNGISTDNSDTANLVSQLGGKLNDALAYHELERGKIADAGIAGTMQIAREVLTWRQSSLTPLIDQVNNVALWSRNQNLFSAAASRMSQIGRVVSFLSSTNNHDLASAYDAAQSSFQDAQYKNIAARQALAQSQPGDQVAALMQQSLTSLSVTYHNLFTVSTIIQGLAPSSGN